MNGMSAMKTRHASKTVVERRLVVVLRIHGKSCTAAKKSAAKKRCIGFPGVAIPREAEVCTPSVTYQGE